MSWKKIESFKGACKATKRDPKVLPDVSMLDKQFQKRIIADYKIMVFAEAINEGWKPDYNTHNDKYTAWFRVKADEKRPSGFGFSDALYAYWSTLTGVGSRLCFETSEKAMHAAKFLEKEFIDHQLMV